MADPNRAEAHEALGAMLLPMLEIDEAEYHCREVIRLGEATCYTYFNLAIALGNKCELEKARAMAIRAIGNSPDEYILDMANQLIEDIDSKTYLGGLWSCKLDISRYKNTIERPIYEDPLRPDGKSPIMADSTGAHSIGNGVNSQRGSRSILMFVLRDYEMHPFRVTGIGEGTAESLIPIDLLSFSDEETGPAPAVGNYAILDWPTLKPIQPETHVMDIPEPGIIILLPRESEEDMKRKAKGFLTVALHGPMRRRIDEHIEEILLERVVTHTVKDAEHKKKTEAVYRQCERRAQPHRRPILVLAVWGRHVYEYCTTFSISSSVLELLITNEKLKSKVSSKVNWPEPIADDYVLVDWLSADIIPETTIIADIPEPGVVLRLPRATLPELRGTAISIEKWILTAEGEAEQRILRFIREPSSRMAIYAPEGSSRLVFIVFPRRCKRLFISGDVVGWWQVSMLKHLCFSEAGIGPASHQGKDYILVDWNSMEPVHEDTFVLDIDAPSIVLLLPKASISELKREAKKTKLWAVRKMRDDIDRHLTAVGFLPLAADDTVASVEELRPVEHSITPSGRVCVEGTGRLGSRVKPFESAQAVLDYLNHSEPERYVFRGQVQEYDGPLLPSGYRQGFRPIASSASIEVNPFAGITRFASQVNKEGLDSVRKAHIRSRGLQEEGGGHDVTSSHQANAQTVWDVTENEFRRGFEQFLNTSYSEELLRTAIPVLRGSTVEGLVALFGLEVGFIISQQYGLTSGALDATTSPQVAAFFATHHAPFYHSVCKAERIGVIYRWPREKATVTKDVLSPLETGCFESLNRSFRRFIEQSKGLSTRRIRITHERDTDPRPWLDIVEVGSERALEPLVFPEGTFSRSRVGRQHAALLWPITRYITPPAEDLWGKENEGSVDVATLVGDILKTHQGEAFFFRHTSQALNLGPVDKFYLWPLQEDPKLHLKRCSKDRVSLSLDVRGFQDLYLEFLLRFLSPAAPVRSLLLAQPHLDKPILGTSRLKVGQDVLIPIFPGLAFIDPGFLVHPSEAEVIASRLLDSQHKSRTESSRDKNGLLTDGPISFPAKCFVPLRFREEFNDALEHAASHVLPRLR